MSGLVVLALLAILVAYIGVRLMRKIGLPLSRERMFGMMIVFVIVVLMVWGQHVKG